MGRLIRLLIATFVTGLLAAVPAATQVTLPYDHVHLAAPDQAKAVEWYQKSFGGETTAEGKDRLLFGKTRFIWMKSDTAKPSAGTAIDHIAFSFPDVGKRLKAFQAAGVKVIGRRMIEDPWGVRIELIEDRNVTGFHHVHLRSMDQAAALGWYQQRFGGDRVTYKGASALKYGDVLVLVEKSNTAPAASAGHALDHVGWRVTSLEKTLDDLKGIKVLQGVTNLQLATGPIRFSFVEDPAGTKIELVQR